VPNQDVMESLAPPDFIDDVAGMDRLFDAIRDVDRIAVDTEADSFFSYRQRVSLIQISTVDGDFIVDPLAGLDLEPLFEVFEDASVTKVFHDAEFDLILLRREYEVQLDGLFDTKVAAVALGHDAVGLAALVEAEFGVKLDKRYQRSDWGKRPLDAAQLDYARLDTHFLIELADRLSARIDACGDPIVRLEVDGECRRLTQMVPKPPGPGPDSWLKIKGAKRLDSRQRRTLEQLHAWRERLAEKIDVPPFKVLGNTELMSIATARPTDRRALGAVLSPSRMKRHGDALLDVVRAAEKLPEHVVPANGQAGDRARRDRIRKRLERLKKWRKARAEQRPTDPSLILHRELVEQLAELEHGPDSVAELAALDLMEQWRVDAYGEEIVAALRDGERRSGHGSH